MKTFTLVFEVDIELDWANEKEIKSNLEQVVVRALNNGTITSDSPATIEGYRHTVTIRDTKDA